MNWQLFSIIWSIASTTVVGIFMIVALVVGFDDIPEIIGVCVAGMIVSIPISWVVTKKVGRLGESEKS